MDTSAPHCTLKVSLYGTARSPGAYELRDFLNRSTVFFEWIDLEDPDRPDAADPMDGADLPVVVFPDGSRLERATVEDVARRLGWVSAPRHKEYDVCIYGAGPAGLSAAVYAASEGLSTVLIERDAIGGQAGTSSMIENYLGFPSGISGAELAERARQQAIKFGVEVLQLREGVRVRFQDGKILAQLSDGHQLLARCNICATGVQYTELQVPGADRLLGRGFYYGAGASEGLVCQEETVVVVGGGNSAGQAAWHLARSAKKVVMVVRGEQLSDSLSHYLIKKLEQTGNIEVCLRTEVKALHGEDCLQQVTLQDQEGQQREMDAQRLFVCIGGQPNTLWATDTPLMLDRKGYLVTGRDLWRNGQLPSSWTLDRRPFELETSVPGCFAAGDVRHGSVKRVATAVGEGAMAVAYVHQHLASLD